MILHSFFSAVHTTVSTEIRQISAEIELFKYFEKHRHLPVSGLPIRIRMPIYIVNMIQYTHKEFKGLHCPFSRDPCNKQTRLQRKDQLVHSTLTTRVIRTRGAFMYTNTKYTPNMIAYYIYLDIKR